MKRIINLLLSAFVLSMLIGCGEDAAPFESTLTGGVYDPSDTLAPSTLSIVPHDTRTVYVTFSEWMDIETIKASISIVDRNANSIGVASTVNLTNNQIKINLLADLSPYAIYTFTINTNAKDFNGNVLLVPMSKEFVYIGSTLVYTDSNDIVAPTITSITPINQISGSSIDASFKIIFDEWIDYNTLSSAITLKESNTTDVPFTITAYTNKEVTIKPSTLLSSYKSYVLSIGTSLKDLNNNMHAITTSNEYVFFESTTVEVDYNDSIAPTVLSISPSDQSINISASTPINIQFSEWVNYESFINSFSIKESNITDINYSILSYVNNTIVIQPTNRFKFNKNYTININKSLIDLNDNNISMDYSSMFTTRKPTLSKTGQTISYTNFDDGYYKIGLDRNFTLDVNGTTFTDNNQKLQWKKDYSLANWSTAYTNCLSLNVEGFTDWRLPNIYELQSLLHYGLSNPATDSQLTYAISYLAFWTENLYPYLSASWYLNMYYGNFYGGNNGVSTSKSYTCVRDITTKPINDLERDNTMNIVIDNKTTLMWEDIDVPAMLWSSAIDYCENNTLGGYTDWRLPNINELFSIVRYETAYKTLDDVFQVVVNSNYWSSTTTNSSITNAWSISFMTGFIERYTDKSSSQNVRCVRGGF